MLLFMWKSRKTNLIYGNQSWSAVASWGVRGGSWCCPEKDRRQWIHSVTCFGWMLIIYTQRCISLSKLRTVKICAPCADLTGTWTMRGNSWTWNRPSPCIGGPVSEGQPLLPAVKPVRFAKEQGKPRCCDVCQLPVAGQLISCFNQSSGVKESYVITPPPWALELGHCCCCCC